MNERDKDHVVSLIESSRLSELSAAELATVRAHCDLCVSCKRAFTATQISELLLKEGAPEVFQAPPFFQTRVLAAWRERQAASEPWAWSRIWKATGALASSMVATVAALAVLTFVLPGTNSSSLQLSSGNSETSAEAVVLNQEDVNVKELDGQASDGQVLTALYETDDDTEK